MLSVSKIVAPTDFSDAAKYGFHKALEIVKHFSATLYPVHVVNPLPTIPGASAPTGFHLRTAIEEMQDNAREALNKLMGEIEADLASEPQIVTGDPGTEIARFADGIEADIIVIASHGQSGWARFVSGSVTEKVIRRTSTPVLVVSVPEESSG